MTSKGIEMTNKEGSSESVHNIAVCRCERSEAIWLLKAEIAASLPLLAMTVRFVKSDRVGQSRTET